MRRLICLCTTVFLLSGCYDSHFGEPGGDRAVVPSTLTISELRSLYAGAAFGITSDLLLTGMVISSDRDENFYRTLCIEQDGAGIEVMAGIDHLHNDYPAGCRVTLSLKGLYVGESYGVLQAGRKPASGSGFEVDYIGGTKAALDAYLTRCDDISRAEPTMRTIADLTPAMCGTLVRIGQLRYMPEDLVPGTWSGYKRFTDAEGHELFTYVRAYAAFAGNDVPAGEVALTGVLQRYGKDDGGYCLKLRDESDCAY